MFKIFQLEYLKHIYEFFKLIMYILRTKLILIFLL